MDQMPFGNQIFGRLATAVEYASLDQRQRIEYDRELKAYRDLYNQDKFVLENGIAQGIAQGIKQGIKQGIEQGKAQGIAIGRAEGEAKGKAEMLRNLLSSGMDFDTISRITKMAIEEIKKLVK